MQRHLRTPSYFTVHAHLVSVPIAWVWAMHIEIYSITQADKRIHARPDGVAPFFIGHIAHDAQSLSSGAVPFPNLYTVALILANMVLRGVQLQHDLGLCQSPSSCHPQRMMLQLHTLTACRRWCTLWTRYWCRARLPQWCSHRGVQAQVWRSDRGDGAAMCRVQTVRRVARNCSHS